MYLVCQSKILVTGSPRQTVPFVTIFNLRRVRLIKLGNKADTKRNCHRGCAEVPVLLPAASGEVTVQLPPVVSQNVKQLHMIQ
jgi:hypothetical protein